MLCERCKIREANIQYTEVMNGVKTEHNLCSQCAKEIDFGPYSAIFEGEFPLGKLLSGLLGMEENVHKEDCLHQITCPTCGMSYDEFVKNSCFGCLDCYGVFDLLISDNIRQMQGSETHIGKHPLYQDQSDVPDMVAEITGDASERDSDVGPSSIEEELSELNQKLQEAIFHEEYELAANYRDKIRSIKEE